MPRDPFADVTDELTLRLRWRKLARRHHPDVNPDDPRAEERFKRLQALYRRARARLAGAPRRSDAPPERDPAPPPPAPLRCDGCGDGFTLGDVCPRCQLPLVDAAARVCEVRDGRVDDLIRALEAPAREPLFELAPEARVPLVGVALVFLAAVQWRAGIPGLALMSLSFALAAFFTTARALRPSVPAWARASSGT
ncbi:MAG: DnaJ domain-containing protein [Myxococcales bacterium]|nr:DnaJ domain-containing protein [Myxococcales bacterium]